ncbi:MAG: WYL domain-containing protein [Burkholderiaceae bacterium]|nr:WYL domain-containing protein [Burkholderiaceae bacterium]
MDFNVRIMKIDQAITEKGIVTFEDLLRATGASPATLKRDISYMRNELKAPITYSRSRGGYLFAKNRKEALRADFYERQAAWFTPEELYTMVTTLENFGELEKNRQGYLTKDMRQLAARLRTSMFADQANADELMKRVKINSPKRKPFANDYFSVIGQGLIRRKRVRLVYYSEHKREETRRVVSPMRLTFYRGRWYLDAWCHERGALRSFNIENVRHADIMDMAVKLVPMKQVCAELDSLYGMYRSEEVEMARIRFTGIAAKLVSKEIWHVGQSDKWLSDDLYELIVPYAKGSPEIVGDILRFGPMAKVMEPASLQEDVKKALNATLKNY